MCSELLFIRWQVKSALYNGVFCQHLIEYIFERFLNVKILSKFCHIYGVTGKKTQILKERNSKQIKKTILKYQNIDLFLVN